MSVGGEIGHEVTREVCGASIAVVVTFGGGEYIIKVSHAEPICDAFQKRRDAEDRAYAFDIVRRARVVTK